MPEMPELVPIGDDMIPEMPRLAPLMPRGYVSVDDPLPDSQFLPQRKTRTAPPKLIPINEAYGNLGEPIWEDTMDAKDGMPNIMDFL